MLEGKAQINVTKTLHYIINKYMKYYMKVLIPAMNWMSEF
jgi:hypothetical protein